jgi:predicted Na+-dependent transporter
MGGAMLGSQFLCTVFNISLAISIIATVLSLGMNLTIAQTLAPLRRIWLVLAIIALNAVLIPAIAWSIAHLFPISAAAVAGLTLPTLGAGSAAALKAAQMSQRANLALAITLVVVLQLVDIVAVPLWAGQVVSGASIQGNEIVRNLLILVLIPLAIALLIRARFVTDPAGWQRPLVGIANVALGIALVVGIVVNWMPITSLFTTWAPVGAMVIVLTAFGLGILIGWQDGATRITTAFVSGMRFSSLGLFIISTQLGADPTYLGPAICFSVFDLFIMLLVAVVLQRATARGAPRWRRAALPHQTPA